MIQTQVGNRDSIMLDNLDDDVSFVQQVEHVGDLLFAAFGVDVQFAERTVEGVADLAVQNVDGQGVAPDHFGDHRLVSLHAHEGQRKSPPADGR